VSQRRYLPTALALLLIGLACTISIPTVQPLERTDPVTEPLDIGLEDASRALVRLRLVAGDLTVRPYEGSGLVRGQVQYNVEAWAPEVQQTTEDAFTTVAINQGIGSEIPLSLSAQDVNIWSVELRRAIPLELSIDMGSGKAQLDLGGLSLTDLSLISGAAEATLTFAQPNPTPLGTLRLTAGTGKATLVSLGNANFDHLSVLGGAGTLDLDFSGALSRSAIADIRAGAGTIKIRVPEALGVRVEFAGTSVSTIDVTGFTEQSPDVYVNAAYGTAPLTLTVKLTTGIGAVSLVSQ